jgi:alkanesulfonate monooxygenase SsuD/methylene tetrahydromethanopterin reductase-like flavin-dependent oxidoreductase (luciferase family)
VRYALSVPNFGDFANPRLTASLARDAEEARWDAFFLWDHLLLRNGNVVGDPWTILTAVALSTERIRLGTMVTPLPRRRPWQVVRQVVTLDHLSNGRAVLGVGLGYPPREEYELFGEQSDDKHRGELLDEALDVVAGLMSGEPFSFEGKHFTIRGVEFAPRPVQRPRIPIWVGGAWPSRPPFRRAARFDGVVPIEIAEKGEEIFVTVDHMREIVAFVEAHRVGDDPFDFVFTGYLPNDAHEAADVAAELESFGVTWWQVSPAPDEGVDDFLEWLRIGPPVA